MPPKIAILLPFYQVQAPYFLQTLESLYAQDFRDWELLLIANNPPAWAWELAHAHARQEPRIRLLLETQQGIAHALNQGLKQARAPYIARIDADDIALPSRLGLQLQALEQQPQLAAIACRCQSLSEMKDGRGYAHFIDWQNSLLDAQAHALNRFVEAPIAHPSVMFRRQLIEDYGFYSTEDWPEDYELWLRWLDAGQQIAKLPQTLLLWRDHPQRLSRQHSHYSEEAFFRLKAHYLARFLKREGLQGRPLVVCGSSRNIRRRASLLQAQGIEIAYFTDVKQQVHEPFLPLSEIKNPKAFFVLNLIAARGVREAIKGHFSDLGFVEGLDFISGA